MPAPARLPVKPSLSTAVSRNSGCIFRTSGTAALACSIPSPRPPREEPATSETFAGISAPTCTASFTMSGATSSWLGIASPTFKASAAPAPNPAVRPERMPRLRSPVTAAVPAPVRTPVISGDSFSKLPRPPNRSGINASGCPVTGFVVNWPVGESEAKPATSTGFMWTSIVSP